MYKRLSLVSIAALGVATFTVPVSAQLLGGGLHGTLDGTLRGGFADGRLAGSGHAAGGLHAEHADGLRGSVRETAGATRDATRSTAGKVREGMHTTTERTRDASAGVSAAARNKVEGAKESASDAAASVDGGISGDAQVPGRRGKVKVNGRGDAAVSRDGLMTGGDLAATGELAREAEATAPAEEASGDK